MKKYLFLTVCLTVFGTSQVTAQVAKVALSHNGNLTMYNAEELSSAINDAVAGDTIYLNEGTFAGGITISKAISLIGAGANTIISGNVSITASGTLIARMLDGLNITGSLSGGASTGLVIRKCQFNSFSCGALKDAVFDRCYCTGSYFTINSNIRNMRVVNSIIYNLQGEANNVSDVSFVNCEISGFRYYDNVKATFINCNVYNYRTQSDSYFSYCSLYQDNGTNTMQNCNSVGSSWASTSMTGTDGTPVGIYGGTTPYTLVPSSPKITSYDLKVDTQNKKLNVNIKVTAN